MSARHYRERLLPTWWTWLLGFGFVAMLAIAFGAALGATVGWILMATGVTMVIALFVLSSPTITVDDETIRVGHANLPHWAIGRSKALTAQETRAARNEHYDPSWYAVLRPVASSRSVVLEVTDERDPHPAWIVTSRHPDRILAALHSNHG